MTLRLTKQQLNCLESEVNKAYPVEACALLFGMLVQEEATVKRVIATNNVLQSTTRFEICTKDFYEAFTKADKDGLVFLGFFHSHPASAVPSRVDLHFMRLWGDAIWLIFSTTENRFAAFHMRNNKVHTLRLRVEGKN